jgi:hypothetical protein
VVSGGRAGAGAAPAMRGSTTPDASLPGSPGQGFRTDARLRLLLPGNGIYIVERLRFRPAFSGGGRG